MNGYANARRVEICADCGEQFTPTGAFRLDIKDGATPICDRCENKEVHQPGCVCLDCHAPDLPIADNN